MGGERTPRRRNAGRGWGKDTLRRLGSVIIIRETHPLLPLKHHFLLPTKNLIIVDFCSVFAFINI